MISIGAETDRADNKDSAANEIRPVKNTRRAPKRSDHAPAVSRNAANVSV